MSEIDIIQVSTGLVESEVEKIVMIEMASGLVETTGPSQVIEVTKELKYVSNKMTFVVGTNGGAPVSAGVKNTYGTRFGDGVITNWTLMTDRMTDVSVNILRSTAFPVFSPILNVAMAGDDYATGSVNISLTDMDVLDFEIVSNTVAAKITLELLIR